MGGPPTTYKVLQLDNEGADPEGRGRGETGMVEKKFFIVDLTTKHIK